MTEKPTQISWMTGSLLLGFGILMLGDGLQGTLLAIRADLEGYSATVTGLIMSSFYGGLLAGSLFTPRIMMRVGHIRVFAALAAMASSAILLHPLFVDAAFWIGLRLISGFCFAGLYVVAESWLNDQATNSNRGKLLSLYMVVTYVGVGVGQLLLNVASPAGFELFILTSVLISMAVVPLLLSAGSSPEYAESVSISIRELYRQSPLGIIGTFFVGLVTATFFALGPVYAQRQGMDVKGVSYFMTAAVLGTILMQWPIGALSDRFDRRRVLTIITLLAGVTAFGCALLVDRPALWLFAGVGLFAGFALPLYSVCVAYINDHLNPNQIIAASGTLVLVAGLGSIVGPILVAAMMDLFGVNSFFWCMGLVHLGTGIFALYRAGVRPVSPEPQGGVTPVSIHVASVGVESIQQHAYESSIADSQSTDDTGPTTPKV
jgi:MFS family permease